MICTCSTSMSVAEMLTSLKHQVCMMMCCWIQGNPHRLLPSRLGQDENDDKHDRHIYQALVDTEEWQQEWRQQHREEHSPKTFSSPSTREMRTPTLMPMGNTTPITPLMLYGATSDRYSGTMQVARPGREGRREGSVGTLILHVKYIWWHI